MHIIDMILKKETAIGENETYGELNTRLSEIGAEALSETVRLIGEGNAPRTPQDDALSCYAPMLDKELAKLDFTKPAAQLHHQICGMNPWPVAYTMLDGKRLKVYRSQLAPAKAGSGKPGQVLSKKKFIVACGEGALELCEVQLEGSKRMDGAAFLNGKRPAQLGE